MGACCVIFGKPSVDSDHRRGSAPSRIPVGEHDREPNSPSAGRRFLRKRRLGKQFPWGIKFAFAVLQGNRPSRRVMIPLAQPAALLIAGIVASLSLCLPTITAQEIRITALLRGTVVTPSGKPLAGVTLDFRRRLVENYNCLDLDYARRSRSVRRTRTAKDGSFAVHLPRGLACQLHVDVPGYAKRERRNVFGGYELVGQMRKPSPMPGVRPHLWTTRATSGRPSRTWRLKSST